MRAKTIMILLILAGGLVYGVFAVSHAAVTPQAPTIAPPPDITPKASEPIAEKASPVNPKNNCMECHQEARPTTKEHAALKPCPRPREMNAEAAAKLPEIMELGQLSDIYVPVQFPHKLHLKMELMGTGGCSTCHHYSEPGKTPACRECHQPDGDAADLKKPSLKGAYHRQCLGCHRDWSHEDDCTVCHAKRSATPSAEPKADTTDMMGRLHPNVTEPDLRIYDTPGVGEGIKVTFRHKEHITVFGKRCVDCHQNENCGRCHDRAQKEKTKRKDPHEDCSACHDVQNDDCTKCHQDKEIPPFDHAKRANGFSLAAYHATLACTRCHTNPKTFKGLTKQCATCHKPDFQPKEFKHERTGLTLDLLHEAAACKDCHKDGIGKPTTCTGCHKDGRTYPDKMPGEKGTKTVSTDPRPADKPATAVTEPKP